MIRSIRESISLFPQKYHKKKLLDLCGNAELTVIDVGATGGPHSRWKPIVSHVHFTTFDPDPRAKQGRQKTTNYPFGLWSEACERSLHLASFPEASSLYPFHPNLERFSNAGCHRVVDQTKIQLKSLDQLNLEGDVLKVDAEGAELNILKGGEKLLKKSIFAVELEVSFLERYEGAPLFYEVDAYLRSFGFELYQLQRHHWIRKNRCHYLYSTPQLVWGNVFYLLNKEALLKKDLRKVLPTLLLYNCHDFALELSEASEDQKLKTLVNKACTASFTYFLKLLVSIIFGLTGLCLFALSRKMRLKFLEYTRDRARELGYCMLSLSRAGPANCSVYDGA